MNPTPSFGPGLARSSLLDQEIAHIRRVMPQSLTGDLGGPILPPSYWRRRLHQLLDSGRVGTAQLGDIDSLLLQIDEFERQSATDRVAPPKPVDSLSGTP